MYNDDLQIDALLDKWWQVRSQKEGGYEGVKE